MGQVKPETKPSAVPTKARQLHLNNQLIAVQKEIDDLVREGIKGNSRISRATLMRMITSQEHQEALLKEELKKLSIPSDDFLSRAIAVAETTFSDPLRIWNQLSSHQRVGFAKALLGGPVRLHGSEVQTPDVLVASRESGDPSSIRDTWYAQRDLNPCCRRERAVS